jgi:hypothetical protein
MNVKDSDIIALIIEIGEGAIVSDINTEIGTFGTNIYTKISSLVSRRPDLKDIVIPLAMSKLSTKYSDLKEQLESL